MNTMSLYEKLEVSRKLTIAAATDQDYYALRAGIYRARKKYLELFAMIDDTGEQDGFQLIVRRDEMAGTVSLELTAKAAGREWQIVETPDPATVTEKCTPVVLDSHGFPVIPA